MKKIALTFTLMCLSAVWGIASAHNTQTSAGASGSLEVQQHAGTVVTGATSTSTSGSQVTTGTQGTGTSSFHSENYAGGSAGAHGTINSNGVNVSTSTNSVSDGSSTGYLSGAGTGNTSGGADNNNAASASGQFQKFQAGVAGSVQVVFSHH